MSENILLPVARMVGGSCYDARLQTNDDGTPTIDVKTGRQASDFTIGIAIEKKGEAHWNQTEWGAMIFKIGATAYPGQSTAPTFSWKIIDGDSTIPNKKNRRPCDQTGYPGHWVMWLTSGWAPVLCDMQRQSMAIGSVMPGDWVQVYTTVVANQPRPGKSHTPGVYLNLVAVAWVGYHKDGRIVSTVNLNEIPFGEGGIPAGVLQSPVVAHNVAHNAAPIPTTTQTAAPTAPPPPPPNPAIWQAAQGPQMTPSAGGIPYAEYIAAGWDDAALKTAGLML